MIRPRSTTNDIRISESEFLFYLSVLCGRGCKKTKRSKSEIEGLPHLYTIYFTELAPVAFIDVHDHYLCFEDDILFIFSLIT